MSEYRYLILSPEGHYLYLSDQGPRKETQQFVVKLKEEGFHHEEERPLGAHVLQVYKKKEPPTDILPPA